MGSTRRETSEATAARFLEGRYSRQRALDKKRSQRDTERRLSRLPAAPATQPHRRIAFDLAEPTLRLIHDVLIDAMHARVDFGDRHALLMIAEQMVAIALGMPPCDDPPLTDREAP